MFKARLFKTHVSRTPSLQRTARFLSVGFLNAFVDVLVFNLFVLILPTKSAAVLSLYNTIAVGCAIINSYAGNRFWTFADMASGTRRETWMFWAQAIGNVAINDAIVVWADTFFRLRGMPIPVASNVSKGLAMTVSSSVSYLLMRLFVFRRRNHSTPEVSGSLLSLEQPLFDKTALPSDSGEIAGELKHVPTHGIMRVD